MKHAMKRVLGLGLAAFVALANPLSGAFAQVSEAGGGSDGGGNTYRGRPLESYAKNPITLSAYQKLMTPLLQDLAGKTTSQNSLDILQNLLLSAFNQKIWYFVPGPLEHVPVDLLDSAVRTDQAVLQGFDRVWIDEDIWNTMNIDDQAKLLLHEAFMGLKILRFASSFRLCRAAYGLTYGCDGNSQLDFSISLTQADYLNVQSMTIETSAHYPKMTNNDWMTLIQKNNLKYSYDWFEKKVPLTPHDLSQLLLKSSVSGFMPTYGYNVRNINSDINPINTPQDIYDYFQKHQEPCRIQAQVTGDKLYLKLSGKTESFDQVIPLPAQIETTYSDLYLEKRVLQQVGVSYKTGQPRPDGGFTFYNAFLAFDGYYLAHVYIQEMVCVDQDCNPYVDVKDGMLYTCSDNAHLFKP